MLCPRRPGSKGFLLLYVSADGILYSGPKRWRISRSAYCKKAQQEEEEEEEEDGRHHSAETGTSVVSMLKECAKRRDLQRGSRIHARFVTKGLLERDMFVGSTLVNMYVKCGALSKAQDVFHELPSPNVVAWNSLLAGYVQDGQVEEAIDCFELMRQQGRSPDAITYITVFKACGITGAVDKGQQLHAEVLRDGFLKQDNFVGTALLDMYAKCDLLGKAQEIFEQLSVRNVVSWTALIAGYAQQGYSREALMCFEQMQQGGLCPNAVTFVCVLKACGSLGDSKMGQELHAHILDKGLLVKNVILGTALVDMYSKCGLLEKAQEVFNQLSECNVVTWNAIIVGYAQHGFGEEALNCFHRMRSQGVPPNAVTFLCLLKACIRIGRIEIGEEVHIVMERDGYLEKDIILANALLDMYAKCGHLAKAQQVFDGIVMTNAVSWNTLIAGHVQNGDEEGALTHFDLMQLEGMLPDAVTYACILKACGFMEATRRGHCIHAQIVGSGLMEKDTFVANAVVDMYAKCGELSRAQEVFDRLVFRDLVSWTALIGGYAQQGHIEEALNGFYQMQVENLSPDAVTFACILSVCDKKEMVDKGHEIHNQIVRDGLLEKDIRIGTALVDMYLKCGLLSEARDVFDELPVHDVVSWTVLISGYAQSGRGKEAIHSFEHMQLRGFWPDATIYASTLKACSIISAVDKGQELHAQIVTYGLFEQDAIVGTALLDMYVKCSMLAEAQYVFDELPEWNVISWNALVAGHADLADGEAALNCFKRMQHVGTSPDLVTYLCVARVCGGLGAAYHGQELHGEMVRKGLLEYDLVVAGNALVDMYANCCMLEAAENVLDKLQRDVISWNALMAGYAQLGDFETVLASLKRMLEEDLNPDQVTFSIVLNTCSRGGLVEEGQMMFETMCTWFYINPSFEHYTIMVDLLGRAGLLDRAEGLIEVMPFGLSLTVWHTLLGACQKWGNWEHGRWAYEHAVQLDGLDAAAYVSMGNICVTADKHDHSIEAKLDGRSQAPSAD